MRNGLFIFIISLLVLSCSKSNDVLSEKEMTSLLVDIHKGEAIIDVDKDVYYNDSLRKIIKQSVLAKHNVSEAKFDSSLVWYGHHIEKYIAIYTTVNDQLEIENLDLQKKAKQQGQVLLAAGDSVNLWNKSPIRIFNSKMERGTIFFDYKADEDFKKGDKFLWKFRIANNHNSYRIFLGIDYTDGSKSYYMKNEQSEGWGKSVLQSDSSKYLKRIYGYIDYPELQKNEIVYIDSLSLIRTRLNPNNYTINFMQKSFSPKKDSIK